MKPKHQRLALTLTALVALIGAALLAASALREEASYFYTPTTLAETKPPAGKAVRLGGMVQAGSVKRAADGVSVAFTVRDQKAEQKVVYKGITPDLFREGSGVVADGALRADGVFAAETLLAKHDENYVPRELKDIDMKAAEHSKDTLAE